MVYMTNCRKCGWFYKNIEDWLKHQKDRHPYVYKPNNDNKKHGRLQGVRNVRSDNMRGNKRVETTIKRKATRDYLRHHKDEE